MAATSLFEKNAQHEKDLRALERVRKIEQKHANDGYKWVKIKPSLRVFVPCDKKGKPTKNGLERIRILKEEQRIK